MNDDIREELAAIIEKSRTWKRRMADGYTSVGSNGSEEIAEAILAEFDVVPKGDAATLKILRRLALG
jgi:hypothetical protein